MSYSLVTRPSSLLTCLMHRFHLPPERCVGGSLRLDGREAHHALHVLRLKRCEVATVLDGAGTEIHCAVHDVTRDSVALAVKDRKTTPPPPCSITLLVGVPKGKTIENIIQKAVELGARRVVPLLTERVVMRLDERGRARKHEQWRQVAIEAIKQCGAAWLPEIETPTTIPEFRIPNSEFELSLVGSLQPERRPARDIFREFEKVHGHQPKSVAVWIGPEGDFTQDELRVIQNSGAQPISLGPLTLRVETAAIYCLSILNHEWPSP